MNRRGISQVITTVLFILIAIAAVILVWAVVKPVLLNSQFGVSSSVTLPESLNVVPDSYQYTANGATILIKWNSGEGNITGYLVVLETSDGKACSVKDINNPIKYFETKSISIDSSSCPAGFNFSKVDYVTVTPYVDVSGKVIEGINHHKSEVTPKKKINCDEKINGQCVIELDSCSNLNQENTLYELNKSFIDLNDGTCFPVTADNVTLDLNEHSVNGGSNKFGIYSNGNENIVVRNGSMENFSYGVYSKLTSGLTVRKIGFKNISKGIYLENNSNFVIERNIMARIPKGITNKGKSVNGIVFNNTVIGSLRGYFGTGLENVNISENYFMSGLIGIYFNDTLGGNNLLSSNAICHNFLDIVCNKIKGDRAEINGTQNIIDNSVGLQNKVYNCNPPTFNAAHWSLCTLIEV